MSKKREREPSEILAGLSSGETIEDEETKELTARLSALLTSQNPDHWDFDEIYEVCIVLGRLRAPLATPLFEKLLDAQGVSSEDRSKILALFDLGKMSEPEIKEKLIAIRPYMAEVFEIWTNSPMQTFTLTSVGMAIGHANIKRLIGEFASLAIWIN